MRLFSSLAALRRRPFAKRAAFGRHQRGCAIAMIPHRRTYLRCIAISTLVLTLCLSRCVALENGLARTPPMGWNSWIVFEFNIDEKLIRSMADTIATNGMRQAGYDYVVVDAGWKAKQRGPDGELAADTTRFPSGIKALAGYVHSKGLKFGIYTDAGSKDCGWDAPGSLGHEEQDAKTFASWGVDFIKEDWCNTEGVNAREVYTKMSRAMLKTDRPMVLSMCEWGDNHPWLWAADIANMWRTTGDSKACWDCGHESKDKPGGYPRGWTLILDAQPPLRQYTGPGHWNDPDLLVAGVKGVSLEESRANFSLWAILAAPLFVGIDLRWMPPEVARIFLNKEVIAVDQDAAGIEGDRVSPPGDQEVWVRPLQNKDTAVALFNRSGKTTQISVTWQQIGRKSNEKLTVRDLWRHEDQGVRQREYSAPVPAHGVTMLRIGATH